MDPSTVNFRKLPSCAAMNDARDYSSAIKIGNTNRQSLLITMLYPLQRSDQLIMLKYAASLFIWHSQPRSESTR